MSSGNKSSTSLPDLAQQTGSLSPGPQATRRALTPLPNSPETGVTHSSYLATALSPAPVGAGSHQIFGVANSVKDEPPTRHPDATPPAPTSNNSTMASPEPASKEGPATTSSWPGLGLLLKALEVTAGIFPPFKAAIRQFSDLLVVFEIASKQRNDYDSLQATLDGLLGDISRHLSGMASPTMTMSVKNLCTGINTELRTIEKKLTRRALQTHIEAVEDPGQVLECYQRIQGHLSRLSLNANLSIWQTVSKLEKEAFLRQLSPTTSAVYNSARSQEIQRRACTTGTREHELARLLEWARNPSAPHIYWMNGMAGTGKTTIAYSLCAELETTAELGASFFCSRLIPECRDVKLIIPAIAYQLARFSAPFCCALLNVLEADPDIHTRVLKIQFNSLLVTPLLEVKHALPSDFVVVIDALDECENNDSVGQILDVLLSHTTENGIPVRFLLSSRPESEIYTRMMSRVGNNLDARMVLHDLDSQVVNRDIATYLHAELAVVGLTPMQLTGLVKLCGALFIFASTTARYIKDGLRCMNHEERVNTVLGLASKPIGKKDKEIDKLYAAILQPVFQNDDDDDTFGARTRALLDTVICAQEPMTVDMLAGLLGEVDGKHVTALLRPLYSVINVADSTGLVTTLHASFPDYMLDQRRSNAFHCHSASVHSKLATACFATINAKQPQFNICGLGSSHLRDDDVLDSRKVIDQAISGNLTYACRYWAAHLQPGGMADGLDNLLWNFLTSKLLLWMEVLNLKKDIHRAPGIMHCAEDWARANRCAKEFTELAHDAWRFVTAFVSHAVSESTPHIYVSMLPFWPDSAPVSQNYRHRMRGAIQAQGPAMSRRQLGLLATWPFTASIRSFSLSPDGGTAALGIGSSVQLIDGNTGQTILGPLEHTGEVNAVSFSPDGSLFASGSDDRTIQVWQADNGELATRPLTGHTNLVSSVAFSPDGKHVVSGSADGTVRVWSLASGLMVLDPLEGQNSGVWSVFVSSDGARIASGYNGGTIRVWDAESGEMLLGPLEGHSDRVNSLCFSPDDARLASGSSDATLRIWSNLTDDIQVNVLEGHTGRVESIAFSADGKQLVSGSQDCTVRLWDVQGTPQLARVFTGHTNVVFCARFSSDGARIVSSSADRTIRVWDARSQGPADSPLQGHSQAVTSVAYSYGGARIVSGSNDGTIYVWDGQSGEVAVGPMKGHTDWVTSVCISSDGSRIASGSNDQTIRLWDANTGEAMGKPLTHHSDKVESVCFSPDGALLASGSEDMTIRLWTAASGEPIGTPLEAHTNWVRSVCFSPNSLRLVSGSSDMTIRVWDVNTRKPVLPPFEGHTDEVWAVCASPDGTRIASGSADTAVRLWDAHSGQSVFGPLQGHATDVYSVGFSPDSAYVISGSDDKTIRLWDARSGQAVGGPLTGHTDPVRSVAFSPDGAQIVSGSEDETIRVWDIADLVEGQEPEGIDQPPDSENLDSSHSLIDDINTDTGPPRAHQSWVLQDDGWVVDSQSRLLAWVPPDLHTNLMNPRNPLLISTKGYVQLDLESGKLGESWSECYKP